MEKIMFLLLAIAFANQVYSLPLTDVKNMYFKGVGKTFETGLNKLMKNIEEKHVPFTNLLKENGCEIQTNGKEIKTFLNRTRVDGCLEIIEDVGDIAGVIQESFMLVEEYSRITLEGAKNVSVCLNSEDLTAISICLLQAFNDFTSQLSNDNEILQYFIEAEQDFTQDIETNAKICFGTNTTKFNDIAILYSKRFCKAKSQE